jgi:hypothetical protein
MVYLSSSQQIFQSQYNLEEVSFHFRWTCYIHWSRCLLNGMVIKYGMEKLITSALISFFVVSATYVGLFYDTANQMFLFCCCFLHCNSLVSVSFWKFTSHGHGTRGTLQELQQRLPVLFLQSWLFPLVSLLADLFRIQRCHYLSVFNMRSFGSQFAYLFKDEDDQYKFLKLNAVVKIEQGLNK